MANSINNDIAINQVLMQMRSLAAAAGPNDQANGVNQTDRVVRTDNDFATVLRNSISSVNELQQHAGQLTTAYQQGDENVDLARVMVSLEKAGLAFEAVTQTRNRLLSAYKDIMNMPV